MEILEELIRNIKGVLKWMQTFKFYDLSSSAPKIMKFGECVVQCVC
jgi:hypothetical protein